METYIVDSNFFIEASKSTYPLDVVVSFWNKVKQLAEEQKILSIDKVRNELYVKNDELKAWCSNNLPAKFFVDSDTNDVMIEYEAICNWARLTSQYTRAALDEFLGADEADAFLAAYASADSLHRIVVTQEISAPNSKEKVKLPDACLAIGVSYANTVQMLKDLGETF